MAKDSKPKYQVRIDEVSRYDWTALVVDMTGEKPNGTTILAKSLGELLTKVNVALMLREKNVSVTDAPTQTTDGNGDVPIILTPSRKIIGGN